MKKLLSLFTVLAAALLLASCGTQDPLSKRVNEVADLGAMPLPGSDFKLHGYRVVNAGFEKDHFVYLVERNGQPVAGSAVNMAVSSGKSTVNLGITSVVLDTPAGEAGAPSIQVQCANEAQCARIVAAIGTVR
jgi:hypothetical protein